MVRGYRAIGHLGSHSPLVRWRAGNHSRVAHVGQPFTGQLHSYCVPPHCPMAWFPRALDPWVLPTTSLGLGI